MDTIHKLVTVIGGIMTAAGLFSAMTGAYKFFTGHKNDNPNAVDQGINSMITGGAMAAISAGLTAAVNAALEKINWG